MLSAVPATTPIQGTTTDDPYVYQRGYGNHHVTEALPGALPPNGTNLQQKANYGLYAEHMNGTSFISSRETVSNVWMYRKRPAAAHNPLHPVRKSHQIEACFLPTNTNVNFTPLNYTWGPLKSDAKTDRSDVSSTSGNNDNITFTQGLKTIGGHGDATIKEGLAVHQYAFNADMHREAFTNNDGDMLLVPVRGVLDVKTELGMLRVKPGMIAVLPAGIRFSVAIVNSNSDNETKTITTGSKEKAADGYVLEIFGTHFALPDLGVLGANCLAHIRDFEYPVAAFDPPSSCRPHTTATTAAAAAITIKLAGRFFAYTQAHTPFDVVAWHGRLAPYRYDLSRFVHLTANRDQLDPTAFCVLTAPSKWPGVSLVDFCIFGEKWVVARDTLRVPYYHRTMATELGGVILGGYGGSVRLLERGGLSFEQAYMPHGESYEAWERAKGDRGEAVKVAEGCLGFMFHVSSHLALTKWATESHPDRRPLRAGVWDPVPSHLVDHTTTANLSVTKTAAAAGGAPSLKHPGPQEPTPPASPTNGHALLKGKDSRNDIPSASVKLSER
ncbi:Homogentisate 1,2-dioxygenase [Bombardia bombarda]|uniref:homogentisate 1,2-dioxygenase n=1 Tax=Bombardia bombarda TaxID=252184 RepID=A0AA39TZ65_9PEZI|nr:Homogentisate 1,2-dioxygenase [Bombardia bombarda]